MDQALIASIAAELASRLPEFSAKILVLQCFLVLIAAGVGAFAGEYLRTRAKAYATKADFDEILAQLRLNTELVESVKSEVGQRDWAAREWTTLRRLKLEELVRGVHISLHFVEQYEMTMPADRLKRDSDPINDLVGIIALYFPEIGTAAKPYLDILRKRMEYASEWALECALIRNDTAAIFESGQRARERRLPLLRQTYEARDVVLLAARAVLLDVMPSARGV